MLSRRGLGCLSQSSTKSGSGMPLVSGSSRHSPQPMSGPLLNTTMAANGIAPFGLGGTKEFTKQPIRKLKLTRDMQRCLDGNNMVTMTGCRRENLSVYDVTLVRFDKVQVSGLRNRIFLSFS